MILGPSLSSAIRTSNAVPIPRPPHGVPIPRPSSQIHRPTHGPSDGNTPLSHSPSSSESPSPFSPLTSTNPASLVSNTTNLTTPPSSASFNYNPAIPYSSSVRNLSYPSVPPPSLSSSFGSPTIPFHLPYRDRDTSASPTTSEVVSRRSSVSNRRGSTSFERTSGLGLRGGSSNGTQGSRRTSVERGARIAETGQLIPRSRAGSQSVALASTLEAPQSVEEGELALEA